MGLVGFPNITALKLVVKTKLSLEPLASCRCLRDLLIEVACEEFDLGCLEVLPPLEKLSVSIDTDRVELNESKQLFIDTSKLRLLTIMDLYDLKYTNIWDAPVLEDLCLSSVWALKITDETRINLPRLTSLYVTDTEHRRLIELPTVTHLTVQPELLTFDLSMVGDPSIIEYLNVYLNSNDVELNAFLRLRRLRINGGGHIRGLDACHQLNAIDIQSNNTMTVFPPLPPDVTFVYLSDCTKLHDVSSIDFARMQTHIEHCPLDDMTHLSVSVAVGIVS
jgi:hypothetical protein